MRKAQPNTLLPQTPWLALVLVGLAATACGSRSDDSAGLPSALETTFELRTTAADSGPVMVRQSASGALSTVRRSRPGTKLLGRVDEVLVESGEQVEKGQILARIESQDLAAAVSQAEAGVAGAEAQLANATAQHERMVRLRERGSVTDKDLEDATAQLRVATAELARAGAALEQARAQLSYAVIRSPLDGWVIERHLQVGDMTKPGAVAFVIDDLSQLEVIADVTASQLEDLAIGDEVVVDANGLLVPGVITRIVPSADPASRTFVLKADVQSNAKSRLRSGMFARLTWRSRVEASEAPRVVSSALVRRGQLEGLFVARPRDGDTEQGRVELRWVKTGRSEDGWVEILSGLAPDERYVVDPQPSLRDGSSYRELAGSGADRERP